ncbi:HTTM domain-containing protein [Granulosicoccus sp. 3-233]|uniref:HTTM domain-containing protein n=1 Tax=Granulosicoccus sp. 3-233 TaxID=3417969 RepID=UPI003D32A738
MTSSISGRWLAVKADGSAIARRCSTASQCLTQPVDIAALAVFRILFGVLMCGGTLRFISNGWIESLYVQPEFHFKYWGFEWVQVPGAEGLYLLYSAIALSAALVAIGAFYRIAIVSFFCLFSYAELMDVTYYLNHYYFVSLLALILCLLSPHRAWSVDVWRKPALYRRQLPAWQLWWLRYQVALLYFYAGLAKFEADWLLHAQPLNIWLPPLGGMPVLGPLLELPWVHFLFSWFAFAFDTTIVAFLLMRKTRIPAFMVVLVFHLFTHLFFNIGLFPLIMVLAAALFLDPSWPRHRLSDMHAIGSRLASLMGWRPVPPVTPASSVEVSQEASGPSSYHSRTLPTLPTLPTLAITAFCLFQFFMPLRHWLYPGTVLWNEQGMRFSWKVMLREKSGSLQYRVVAVDGETRIVTPGEYLTEQQYREMAGQPDLILQLAHHIRDEYNARGDGPVSVFADSLVSLNGRATTELIDPEANLAEIDDGVGIAHWITAAPEQAPQLQQTLRLVARE